MCDVLYKILVVLCKAKESVYPVRWTDTVVIIILVMIL